MKIADPKSMMSDFPIIHTAYYYTPAVLAGKSPKTPKPDKRIAGKKYFCPFHTADPLDCHPVATPPKCEKGYLMLTGTDGF
jgi:hypothetical protein